MTVAIRYLPLLLLYLAVVWLYATPEFQADEGRYVKYAEYITQGYFSPPDDPALGNGPGYSLLLAPFVYFEIPWIFAKLLNALMLFAAVLYFYATLRFYVSARTAFWTTYVFGLYSLFIKFIELMHTEVLGVLLICGLIYHYCASMRTRSPIVHVALAALHLAYLALSKIFFGYPLLVGTLAFGACYLFFRNDTLRRATAVFALALALCVPYLVYTYSVTGKVFYWGTKGGASLYWMTSPHALELGDWKANTKEQLLEHNEPALIANHGELFERRDQLSNIEWDDLTKRRAIENVVAYPGKFIKNWIANIGRLMFNYPYSYRFQTLSTYYYLLPNFLLFALCLAAVVPSVMGWRRIPPEFFALIFFAAVSFAGSTLLSATVRYIIPLVPIAVLWLVVVFARNVRLRFETAPLKET